MSASKRFVAGPASDTRAISFRPSRRLKVSTGTGLAPPKMTGEPEISNISGVPIGFKHISKIMIEDDVMIGAEESGGIGIKGHLPERDGVYNGMLYLELLAEFGKSISEMKKELDDEFGKYFYQRNDVHTTEDKKQNALKSCKAMKIGDEIGGKKILSIDDLDGYKFYFENGWIIVRASGTEPLLRIYCETTQTDQTNEILSKTIIQLGI